MMKERWYERARRRILFDMHVNDWDPRLLSQFDPKQFVDNLRKANITTVTVPANGHTGLCYYPTQVGKEHENVKGRNILGQIIDLAHRSGLNVIVYYCMVYVDWYWEQHPEARIVDADGKREKVLMNSAGAPRRFSVNCINNPGYRDFVVAQLTELCTNYDFEGMWPDMTFWATVCYCPACQQRYAAEVGGNIPKVISWTDPMWVGFQRKRQEWLVDFAHLVTSTIRQHKPDVTISHQSVSYSGDWLFGASAKLAQESDWLAADLYADRHQLSFYAKLFYSLSQKKPFEHLNTWHHPDIWEHVVPRTQAQLEAVTFDVNMNGGALAFIDAVDPLGTINPQHYEMAGRVFNQLEQYESYMGGQPIRDVGIFFSMDALFDLAENGSSTSPARYIGDPLKTASTPTAHRNAAISAARNLVCSHIPYGVVTRANLGELSRYQVIVLPNVVMLAEEEIRALKAYVAAGGSLYASKNTSLVSIDGHRQANFMLADLFGIAYEGETPEVLTYVSPSSGHESLFSPFSAQYPSTLRDTQVLVKAQPGAEILATITLPFTDPKGTRYASILTDPPGASTSYPAIVLNRYGKGKVIYAAGTLETWEHDSQRPIFINLLRLLATRPFAIESNAPKSVEMMLYDQPEHDRCVLNVLNFQAELPNIPVEGTSVQVNLLGNSPQRAALMPGGAELSSTIQEACIEFVLPRLETFALVTIEYRH
jgi:hypothetical protein